MTYHFVSDVALGIDARGDRNTITVLIADRAAFDAIAGKLSDHGMASDGGHVITKTVGTFKPDQPTVIFQHWIQHPASTEPLSQVALIVEARARMEGN